LVKVISGSVFLVRRISFSAPHRGRSIDLVRRRCLVSLTCLWSPEITKPESVKTLIGRFDRTLAATMTARSSMVLMLTGSAPREETLYPVYQNRGLLDLVQPSMGWGETRANPL
jgi:hypothetical protein